MKSQTLEQAELFFNENKERLLNLFFEQNKYEIDVQAEHDQIAVFFKNGASICFQNSDMNGNTNDGPYFRNAGADAGLETLRDILAENEEFNALVAEDEYWSYTYVDDFINLICETIFEKEEMASKLSSNDI